LLTVDLVLRNAKIFHDEKIVKAGIAVERGKIVKIAKDANLPSASIEIDCKEMLVIPGVIDAHVHLRDQELVYKEDFISGTSAAANGGVTSVLDMPNNKPVTMDVSSLCSRMSLAKNKIVVNVGFFSAFPSNLEEIPKIVFEGAMGFKLYMSEKIGGIDPSDNESLIAAFIEAEKMNVPVCLHAEDQSFLKSVHRKIEKNKEKSFESYLKMHSPDAEVMAVEKAVKIAQKTKAKIHFCHISTAQSLRLIVAGKQSGLPVTCEVTPHHLLLSSVHLKDLGAFGLSNPPLRSEKDIHSLWNGVQAGEIDIFASDHAPHSLDEKKKSEIWQVSPGIVGLETMLPLMLTQINKGVLSIRKLVRMTSKEPARIFAVNKRGKISEGYSADLVVVNLKKEWRIDSSKFYSKAKFSPYEGWKVKGKPMKTFVNGHLVMDDGEVFVSSSQGQIIRRGTVPH